MATAWAKVFLVAPPKSMISCRVQFTSPPPDVIPNRHWSVLSGEPRPAVAPADQHPVDVEPDVGAIPGHENVVADAGLDVARRGLDDAADPQVRRMRPTSAAGVPMTSIRKLAPLCAIPVVAASDVTWNQQEKAPIAGATAGM